MSTDANAHELLSAANTARIQTRRARQSYWFPLLVFGALVAGASPFYIARPSAGPGRMGSGVFAPPLFEGGGSPAENGRGASIYWIVAFTIAYGAVLLFYRLRAQRSGVASRIWPFIAVGLGLLLLLVLTGPWVDLSVDVTHQMVGLQAPMGDASFRGLVPLLVIGVGLVVLAWSERSTVLTAFALCYLALSLVANLYDLSNLLPWSWLGNGAYTALPDLLLPAAALLLGGVFFGLRAWRVR